MRVGIKLAKRVASIQKYNLAIVYKTGKTNTVPDALSRVSDNCAIGVTTVYLSTLKSDLFALKKHQIEDPLLQTLMESIDTGRQPLVELTPTQQRPITVFQILFDLCYAYLTL